MQKKCVHLLEMSTFSKVGEYLSYFRKFITFIPIFEIVNVSGIHRRYFGEIKERKK